MKKIFVCSKLRSSQEYQVERNKKITKDYCRKLTIEGFLPLAPHIYFTQFLDDQIESERMMGVFAGTKWLWVCDEVHVLNPGSGISDGMEEEIKLAKRLRKIIKEIEI